MSNPMLKLRVTLENLLDAMTERVFELDSVESVKCGYKTSNTPPTEGYEKNNHVVGEDSHYWFRASFDTPEAPENSEYFLKISNGVSGWEGTNPQFIVYLNGEMAQGCDMNHRTVALAPSAHYEMYNYCYSANWADFTVKHEIIRSYDRIKKLYYDMLVPYEACRDVYREDSWEYAATLTVLEQAANAVDFRDRYSCEYFESIERAIDIMEREFYDKLCSTEGKPSVNCLGHTHIDVEWLWDRFVTKEKIQRSFATAKALMDKYSHYKFMLSQPELYRYLKEEAPEKYEELRTLVRDGRWEPEGAMYVECDCNLTSGESLVRQILKGTQFFRREFGKECHALFLPDVFGYSAALPQILKKSGIDYFVTSKISWNDTNTMPYDAFMWQGIDGTEIFSTFITGQHGKRNTDAQRATTYNGQTGPAFIYGTWQRQRQKQYVTSSLNTYGYGDGGGGPTEQMLEILERMMRGLLGLPVARSVFLYDYLKEREREMLESSKKLRKTPLWVGELYLEYHRGTYTTMANNKRGNRKGELALQKCESLSVLDLILGGNYDYDELNKWWHVLLHDQFHDILPGSSIKKVYDLSAEDYNKLFRFTEELTREKLERLGARVSTDGGILVYNALGFARRGAIRKDGKYYVTECEIPAFGYAVIRPEDAKKSVISSENSLENAYYVLKFDDMGRICSLYDKRVSREILSGAANEIRFYEDYPSNYDAWEIDSEYATKMHVAPAPISSEVLIDGERTGMRFTRRYMNSDIIQTVWLTYDGDTVDIDTEVDWHEKHQMMRIAFPTSVRAQNATFEIQYGHTQRPTHRNTSWDAAKFEVCAHKWVDLSESGYGVALLNESKYGHSVLGGEISITALRSPTYPNPTADEGKQRFTLSLMPHVGTFADSGVIEAAYSLNQPLDYIEICKNDGPLPESLSLVSSSSPSVIIECVKRAEDSDELIVRLYEAKNSHARSDIRVCDGFSKATLCDLMERPVCELEMRDNTVSVDMSNFEIKTIKFSR